MRGNEKKMHGNSIIRMIIVAVSFLAQAGWILVRVQWLNAYSEAISAVTGLLTLVVVLKLNSKNTNSAMKMPWIMLIMAFPLMGLMLYLLMEILGDPGVGKRLRAVRQELASETPENARQAFLHLEDQNRALANQSRYLWNQAGYPVYENTLVKYYAEAKDAFRELKQDLEKAEHFIFMEYFIVEEGSAFRELEEILIRKA